MKCEKCGYMNSLYDIICNNCGSPLNIEDNIELKKQYNHKPRAIDIDEIDIDDTEFHFNKVKKQVKISVILFIGIIFVLSIIFTGWIFKEIRTGNVLIQIEEFREEKSDGILYIGRDNNLNESLNDYSNKYEFNYLYISTENITKIKKNKIEDKLGLDKISSTIVYLENGKVVDYLHGANNDKINESLEFLIKQNLISNVIGDPQAIIDKFNKGLNLDEPVIIYIANNKHELSEKNNQKISSFCEEYSINYVFIEGYMLNEKQKLRILNKLNYSDIHDELVVFVDEKQIKEVSEFVPKDENEYFDLASSYGIIDGSSADSLVTIDFNNFKTVIASDTKNIIMVGSNDCKYCEQLKPIIGKIGIQNNLTIYYIKFNSDELNTIKEYFNTIGYNGIISFPLVIVTEKNKVLDHIIGLSDKDIYDKKFKELGVIR